MLAKLSSKGQLVIPKSVRRSMGLQPGAMLRIEVVEDKITLEPVAAISPIEVLFGKYAGATMLDELEDEHRQEIRDDLS